MKISRVNNVNFSRIVETFRRETTNTWGDGVNSEVVSTTYDTFEYVKEEEEEDKKGEI